LMTVLMTVLVAVLMTVLMAVLMTRLCGAAEEGQFESNLQRLFALRQTCVVTARVVRLAVVRLVRPVCVAARVVRPVCVAARVVLVTRVLIIMMWTS
jgi:hypothetical protein